jgi:hypothetical protein
MARLRGSAWRQPIWVGLAVATLTVWLVATIPSLALPVVETGSDPTRIPIAAMVTSEVPDRLPSAQLEGR